MDPADLVASEGTSPFAGGGLAVVAPPVAAPAGSTEIASSLASPFAEAFDETGGAGAATGADLLVGELQDEEFDEALDSLVDEVAARHLSAMPSWSAGASVPDLAANEAEAWVATVAARADRYLEQFEQQYAHRRVDSLVEGEVDAASAQLASGGGPEDAMEQFLGGIVKKVFNTAKSAVKAGIKAAGSLLSIGKLFGLARKLVPWLLRRVLDKAMNRLPKHLRGPAAQLAGKLGAAAGAPQSEGEALAAEFDDRLSRAVLAPNEAAADQVMAEAAEEEAAGASEPVAALDAARARLTSQLAEATPGQPPVVEIEQFVPAVMAVLPLVRTGIKIFGRDRFRGLVARGISELIKGHIGPQAAQALAPRIADVGMKLLSLEAEDPATLGSEALVSTVEDTIREVAALPDESLGEPLRLQTEIEEAFSAAAARHLPRSVLNPEATTYETDDEAGEAAVWVAMPRARRPHYRYRKCTRVYRVPIRRPQARAIVLRGEDTLEDRLLDAGVGAWPVEAEVHLYEAVPGTRLGHIAAFEGEEPGEAAPVPLGTDEIDELTPETAALLLGRPGLGRPGGRPGRGGTLRPGQRFFRVVVPGMRVRRRRRRIVIRLDAASARPALRVHVRLTEREGHDVAADLAKNAHAAVIRRLRGILGPRARKSLAERLGRQAQRALGAPLPAGRADALANQLAEAMLTSLSQQVASAAATLGGAARDPAPGLTLTFAFTFADRAAVAAGAPDGPTLSIRSGYRRG